MGKVVAVCRSEATGTSKTPVDCGVFRVEQGLVGDSHAGLDRVREVSLLALESIGRFNRKGYSFKPGDFAENITTEGIELPVLPIGSRLEIGSEVILEITQIGKKCHLKCDIYKEVGKCIMPKEGVFAAVIRGGEMKPGDEITLQRSENELISLQEQLRKLEKQFAETQQRLDAHSDFRNALIWISQDINKIRSQIEKLEKKADKS
jgi:MOSC domain-containing protein YiiM